MKDKKLSNKAGVNLTGNWVLPAVGTPGTIQNKDSEANGYLSTNGNTAAGSTVVEEALDASDDGQKWIRSSVDGSGYFTLMNTNSKKYLTASPANNHRNTLTIEGMTHFLSL